MNIVIILHLIFYLISSLNVLAKLKIAAFDLEKLRQYDVGL